MTNLCKGMKKPTVSTGENGDCVHKCIANEKLILEKTQSAILGLLPSSDNNEGSIVEGTEVLSLFAGSEEENGAGSDNKEYNNGNVILDDAKLSTINCGSVAAVTVVDLEAPRPSSTTSNISTPTAGAGALRRAAAKATSSSMSQKTKNRQTKIRSALQSLEPLFSLLRG